MSKNLILKGKLWFFKKMFRFLFLLYPFLLASVLGHSLNCCCIDSFFSKKLEPSISFSDWASHILSVLWQRTAWQSIVLGLPPLLCLVPDTFVGAPSFKPAH